MRTSGELWDFDPQSWGRSAPRALRSGDGRALWWAGLGKAGRGAHKRGMARRDLSGAVDFAHLETYAGHDSALVDEVLGLFEQQAATWGRLLDPMAPGWRDAAHTLKGSALGVGAFQMAQACDAAEAAGEGAPPAERVRLTERVRDAMDAALQDVAAYRHARLIDGLRAPL